MCSIRLWLLQPLRRRPSVAARRLLPRAAKAAARWRDAVGERRGHVGHRGVRVRPASPPPRGPRSSRCSRTLSRPRESSKMSSGSSGVDEGRRSARARNSRLGSSARCSHVAQPVRRRRVAAAHATSASIPSTVIAACCSSMREHVRRLGQEPAVPLSSDRLQTRKLTAPSAAAAGERQQPGEAHRADDRPAHVVPAAPARADADHRRGDHLGRRHGRAGEGRARITAVEAVWLANASSGAETNDPAADRADDPPPAQRVPDGQRAPQASFVQSGTVSMSR